MSDQYLGEIRMVGFNFAPYGWAECNGQLLPISQNNALFALIGTFYGGNGVSNFQLPNFQSRVPMHMGQGPGLHARVIGEAGGAESTSILISNLPPHNHQATFTPGGGGSATVIQASPSIADSTSPAGNYIASGIDDGGGTGTPQAGYVTPANAGTLGNLAGVSGTGGSGGTVAIGLTGQGLPIDNMPPYLVVNFIIALQGIYPTRG